MKIEIEGKKYVIDTEKALSLGVLKEDKVITSFEVGDLYIIDPHDTPVVIVEHGYKYSSTDLKEPKLYNIIGFNYTLQNYSDFRKGATEEQMIEFLNRQITFGAKFIKNINQDFHALVQKVTSEVIDSELEGMIDEVLTAKY